MEHYFTQFAAETSEKGGLAVLGIDPLALLLQLASFLILFFLLKKFAFSKIATLLEERRITINKGIDLGLELEAEKRRLDEQVNRILHEARGQADKIVAAGHHEAGVIIKEAEDAARRKIDAMLADAHAHISEETERARAGLEKEMTALVARATEVLIQEKLDAQKDAVLIERLLKEVKPL